MTRTTSILAAHGPIKPPRAAGAALFVSSSAWVRFVP
nr:MAG TPA_asm: hypothetical protein [Caudoviricetes sp.]